MDISNIGERILNRFRKPQKERALVFVDYEHWFFGYKNLFGLKPNIKEWYDSICTRFQVEEAFFFADFTGIPVLKDEPGHIRTVSDSIIETDMERAAAMELMGGKRNSNVISALISDFSIAENSLQTALNSTGSAAKENEKYLDSIAGKLSQFEAQFESLSTSVVDSGLPKFFIELGTNVLSATEGIINFIDVFPALMGLLSGGLSLTGQKAGKSNMPSYASCDLIAA